MTKQIHRIAAELQASILATGLQAMTPAARDGWAALVRWHQAGERVWRIEPTVDAPELPPDLLMASAPLPWAGLCYTGPERGEWIVVARHRAEEVIPVHGDISYAFPEPMITYVTQVGKSIATGCLNLDEAPTWADIYLPAGRATSVEGHERWLNQDEVAVEETRLMRALRHWYGAPGIVV